MRSVVLLSLSVSVAAGCVTTRQPVKQATDRPIIEKAQDTQKTEARETPRDQETDARPTGPQLWKFVVEQTQAQPSWGENERNLTERMRNQPEASSLAEAALTIAIIRSLHNPLHQEATSFAEEDLGAPAPATTQPEFTDTGAFGFVAPEPFSGNGPSLEKTAVARGINIPDALATNPLLGSPFIARQALDALRMGPNSGEFIEEVVQAVKARVSPWNDLSHYLGSGDVSLSEGATETEDAGSSFSDNLPPNPTDLRSGDNLIVSAQKLADQGKYKEALTRIANISESSPLYSVAQEKNREFSNRAVQDLRRKAAQAFRSALPAADLETRAQYLREAKAFLEQAIQNYPQAPQLPTVRENLRVISQDLERLESGRG